MAYVPLTMPTFTGDPDYAKTANFLATAAQNLVTSGNSFLQTLTDLKSIDFAQVGDLPAFNSVVWVGTNPGSIERPTRPTINLSSIDALIAQLNSLVAPTAPTETFNYTEPGYSSILRGPMIEKLLNDILNGGYGIDTNDEVALFNRERDRESLASQSNIEEAKRQAASLGFAMPQGSLYNTIQKSRQDYLAKISSVNRDITLRRSELYVQQRARVIEQVLQSENQSIELYNAIQNRAVRIAEVEVQMAIALFDAGIRLFQTRQTAILTQIDAAIEAAKANISIYASDVQAYAAFVNALVAGATIDIANSRNILSRDIAAHQARTDIVKFRLQQLITTVESAKEINKFGTEFFRTALGSAMNGINGLAVSTQEV